jgi:hypothetical protein
MNGNAVLSISPPDDGEFRARKIISRSRARATGKFPSWKMGRMMHWESHNERNAMCLLDANPVVRAFHEQPFIIRYIMDGEEHLHFPDLLVELQDSKEIWEVKPKKEAKAEEVAKRTAILTQALPAWGYTYRVILGEELATQPRLSNALTVLRFGRKAIDLAQREHLRILFQQAPLPWQAFTTGEHKALRAVASRLILEGVITLDMQKVLTDQSVLTWARS